MASEIVAGTITSTVDRTAFMRDLLLRMFKAWELHEASWVSMAVVSGGAYSKTASQCFIKACDGDERDGYLLELFAHWANDIQTMAPHYGIGFDANGKLRTDIPPAPSPHHWWNEGVWQEPTNDDKDAAVAVGLDS
jgi:hypothetical protein